MSARTSGEGRIRLACFCEPWPLLWTVFFVHVSAAATQRWMVSPRTTFGIESAAARVCASYRTLPLNENDIELGNVTRMRILLPLEMPYDWRQ
jgi:hypothetical protein